MNNFNRLQNIKMLQTVLYYCDRIKLKNHNKNKTSENAQ